MTHSMHVRVTFFLDSMHVTHSRMRHAGTTAPPSSSLLALPSALARLSELDELCGGVAPAQDCLLVPVLLCEKGPSELLLCSILRPYQGSFRSP